MHLLLKEIDEFEISQKILRLLAHYHHRVNVTYKTLLMNSKGSNNRKYKTFSNSA